jgi:hypothetical protein
MIQKKRYTDNQKLAALLIEAAIKAEHLVGRPPTREAVVAQLFPGDRGDPEAEKLAGMLHTLIDEILVDWYEPPEREGAL